MKAIHATFYINAATVSAQTATAFSICLFLCMIVLGETCRYRPYNLAASKTSYFTDTWFEERAPFPYSASAINIKPDSNVIYKPRRFFPRAFEIPVYDPSQYIPRLMAHTYIGEPYIIKILRRYSILSVSTAGRAP